MTEHHFLIDHIPDVLYGDAAEKAYLLVHGQCGRKEEGLAFAEIACPAEYQVLAIDLPEHGARKGEKDRFNPWTLLKNSTRSHIRAATTSVMMMLLAKSHKLIGHSLLL